MAVSEEGRRRTGGMGRRVKFKSEVVVVPGGRSFVLLLLLLLLFVVLVVSSVFFGGWSRLKGGTSTST
jgi:hypothetical protein